jgi:hypothetical protein
MPKIHREYDNDTFIGILIARAADRRQWEKTVGDEGHSFVEHRSRSDLCYAYSTSTDYYYVGYSSIAGGMYGNRGFLGDQRQNLGVSGKITDRELPQRRLDRLVVGLPSATQDPQHLGRPVANCAEACAYSIALSYDERLGDLFFISFYPSEGDHQRSGPRGGPLAKPPCGNCKTWLSAAFGYWEDGCKFP